MTCSSAVFLVKLSVMNGKNKVIITYGLYFIDILCIVISFIGSTYIRFGNFRDMGDKNSHFLVCLVFVLVATVYTFVVPWHNNFMSRRIIGELWQIVKMNIVMVLLAQAVMYFMKWADSFSRFVMAIFFGVNVVLSFGVHMLFRRIMRVYLNSELVRTKVLVITEEEMLEEVNGKLSNGLGISYQIVKSVTTEEISKDSKSFYDEAMQMALDEIFVFAPEWDQNEINEVIHFFDDMGVVCNYCVELPGISNKRSTLNNFGDYSVMTYSHFQLSYKKLVLKRVMDIVGSIIGCLITIVFIPFVALAIKIDSRGPVFFTQERVGRNGRRFKIIKFRSMFIDAEARKKELEKDNEVEGLMFKIENDPRITKVGRFLRKTSIDELPQFFNILGGDMSLVGTRPPTVDEFEKYNRYYRRRLSMTPGLTGLWQVSGRSDIDNFDDVVKLDLEYIDNWSLGLDIRILFKTIKVVFTGRGSK